MQIENYNDGERNPYNHTEQDRIAYINSEYLLEQMKYTTAIAAHLAVPYVYENSTYLPFIIRCAC